VLELRKIINYERFYKGNKKVMIYPPKDPVCQICGNFCDSLGRTIDVCIGCNRMLCSSCRIVLGLDKICFGFLPVEKQEVLRKRSKILKYIFLWYIIMMIIFSSILVGMVKLEDNIENVNLLSLYAVMFIGSLIIVLVPRIYKSQTIKKTELYMKELENSDSHITEVKYPSEIKSKNN
jgi:hypothetical protein